MQLDEGSDPYVYIHADISVNLQVDFTKHSTSAFLFFGLLQERLGLCNVRSVRNLLFLLLRIESIEGIESIPRGKL